MAQAGRETALVRGSESTAILSRGLDIALQQENLVLTRNDRQALQTRLHGAIR